MFRCQVTMAQNFLFSILRRFMGRISRYPKKKIASYAYVDLENLDEVLKEFRRQRESAKKNIIVLGKKRENLTDEPRVSSSEEENVKPSQPAVQSIPKNTWFYNMNDAYNHIKINPEAPDITELIPKGVFQENDNNWWFYHQADFTPFQD